MKNDVLFALDGVTKLLNKSTNERKSLNSDSYHTLINSMGDYLSPPIITTAKREFVSVCDAFIDVLNNIDNEMEELKIVISQSLDKNEFKEHHKWIMSWQKLYTHKSGISGIIENYNFDIQRRKNLPQNKN